MSYDLIVYTQRERLPDPHRFVIALAAATPAVVLDEERADLRRARAGFVRVRLGDGETGFELYTAAITQQAIDDFRDDVRGSGQEMSGGNARHLAILTSCDTTLTLVAKDELGATAARAVARVLARLTEGHLTDPQTGVTTRPSDETP